MYEFIKKTAKRWFRNVLVLLILAYLYPGFTMVFEPKTVFLSALVLTFIQMFLQPLLKMLFLPVNIITMGMFKWLITTTHLLLLALVVETIRFVSFSYNSFGLFGINIPGGHINIIFSVILGTILYRYLRKGVLFLT